MKHKTAQPRMALLSIIACLILHHLSYSTVNGFIRPPFSRHLQHPAGVAVVRPPALPSQTLVIVESPTKAGTIQNYLNEIYPNTTHIVKSCMGHVRDLPSSRKDLPKSSPRTKILGVDTANDYEPVYVTLPSKRDVIFGLKDAVRTSDDVVLATDEDREGEAMSYHLREVLSVPDARRVSFCEISSSAMAEAFGNCRELDMNLVRAQECRRVVDRLAGYSMSPLLMKSLSVGLTAGRVQSVGLGLVVKRELERLEFVSADYWDLEVEFEGGVLAKIDSVDGKRVAQGRDFDDKGNLVRDVVSLSKEDAELLLEDLKDATWNITDISSSERSMSAPPPFITSTLQQEASTKLNFGASQTMKCAQKLYENGLITYMRTDNPNLSVNATTVTQEAVEKLYGSNYTSSVSQRKVKKGKNVQESHEAIRPSITNERTLLTPAQVRIQQQSVLNGVEFSLYELIYKRTLASQMSNQILNSTTVTITARTQASSHNLSRTVTFKAKTTSTIFPGYRIIYAPPLTSAMEVNTILVPITINATQHTTTPPKRYSEASFISTLEQLGVGRPSTYASIIKTMRDRGYVHSNLITRASRAATGGDSSLSLKTKQLIPSLTALAVYGVLNRYAPSYLDPDFTCDMESKLDDIAFGNTEQGKLDYLREYYEGQNGLEAICDKMEAMVKDANATIRRVDLKGIHDPWSVCIGPWGPYVQKGDDKMSLPSQLAVEWWTITPQILQQVFDSKSVLLGQHQETNRDIYYKTGRYGGYLQYGTDDDQNKTNHMLPKHFKQLYWRDDMTLTLEQAMGYVDLPRVVTTLEGKQIVAAVGRYGAYLKYDGKFVSVEKDEDILIMSEDSAQEIVLDAIQNKKVKGVLHHIGEKEKSDIVIKNGRFGPYINWKKVNAKLPSEYTNNYAALSLNEAWDIISEKLNKNDTKSTKSNKSRKEVILPPKPKRPLSSYIIFCNERRKQLKKLKNASIGDSSKILAQLWSELPLKEKEIYQKEAQELKTVYLEEKKEWEKQCHKLQESTSSKTKSKKKRPKSAYHLFCAEKRPAVKEKFSTFGDVSKELARQWSELDIIEKNKYQTLVSEESSIDSTIATSKKSKRRKSAYLHFCSDKRPSVSKEFKTLGDVSKELGRLWSELDDEKKQKYHEKAIAKS